MKRLGQKRVQFSKIIIPGTVKLRQLMAEPRIKELAKSFKEDSGGRPLQPPTLDAATYRLVAGADRFAACKLNGDQSTIFELVEGDEKELRRLSIVENLRRRNDDQQKLAKDLVDAAEREITQEAETGQCPELESTTKPVTFRGAAIKRVAKETGKSEAAIKKAVQREEAKGRKPDLPPSTVEEPDEKPEPAKLPAPPPPIRTLGLDVSKEILEAATDGQTLVDEMSALFTSLATKLTAFEKRFPELGQQQRAREGMEQAAHAIRSLRPACLCPHCKAQPKPIKTCAGCRGLGVVPKAKLVDVPKELMAEGDEAGIYIGGKFTLLDTGF